MTNQHAVALGMAGLCVVLFGCETRDCLRYEKAYGYKTVCYRYSDTGHCAYQGQEQYSYDRCVEYAEPAQGGKAGDDGSQ